MKLKNNTTNQELTLPNDLLWTDETWSPVTSNSTYTITGALVIEYGQKQAGRPISLQSAQSDMGWVTRATVETLQNWANIPALTLTLTFEYLTDGRQFNVIFVHDSQPVEAKPVKNFPQHDQTDWFTLQLKFLEIPT